MNVIAFFLVIVFLTLILPIILHKARVIPIVWGIILLIMGIIAVLVSNDMMHDIKFIWNHYGTSRYEYMHYAKIGGIIFIIVGVMLLITGIVLFANEKDKTQSSYRTDYCNMNNNFNNLHGVTKKCPGCGADVAIGSRFCPNCSTSMEGTRDRVYEESREYSSVESETPKPADFCPNCGYNNIKGGKFCPKCGTKLI